MTRYESFQQHITQLASLEAEKSAFAAPTTDSHDEHLCYSEKLIVSLADQLHYLTQLESGVNTKRLQIIDELNQVQGRLKAKEIALHRKHKDLKMQDKMTRDEQIQKELEAQMKEFGGVIRRIEDLVRNIQSIERRFVNSAKQEISTKSFIAKKAGVSNDEV